MLENMPAMDGRNTSIFEGERNMPEVTDNVDSGDCDAVYADGPWHFVPAATQVQRPELSVRGSTAYCCQGIEPPRASMP